LFHIQLIIKIAYYSSMRKAALVAISFVLLTLPVTLADAWKGEGMMSGPGSGSGSGAGPHYSGSEDRPIGEGSRQRFGSDRPDMGILDEDGNGLSMTVETISCIVNGTAKGIDHSNSSWTLKASGTSENFTKEYSLDAPLGGGAMSRILFRYHVKWQGEEGKVDYDLSIDDLPENGTLRVMYGFQIQGEGLGSFQGSGKRMMIRDREGSLMGALDHSDSIACGTTSRNITVEWDSDGQNATMYAVAQIEGTSAEMGGTMTILEEFITTLGDMAGEAVDYVLDHIVSFSIGTAVLIIVGMSVLAFVGRRQTGPEGGLDLRKNRYYRP
jgi:hypothetical protein